MNSLQCWWYTCVCWKLDVGVCNKCSFNFQNILLRATYKFYLISVRANLSIVKSIFQESGSIATMHLMFLIEIMNCMLRKIFQLNSKVNLLKRICRNITRIGLQTDVCDNDVSVWYCMKAWNSKWRNSLVW